MKEILYIIMCNDFASMNTGKAIAQGSHAVADLSFEVKNSNDDELKYHYNKWLLQNGINGKFGTTIVLEGLMNDIENLLKQNVPSNTLKKAIIDNTYPFKMQKELIKYIDNDVWTSGKMRIDSLEADKDGMIQCHRKEMTCAYIFAWGEDSEFEEFKQICNYKKIKLHH